MKNERIDEIRARSKKTLRLVKTHSLCIDAKNCHTKKCVRHPDQYAPHPNQSYMHFKGTEFCRKTKIDEANDPAETRKI